jgi:hypothetical protein
MKKDKKTAKQLLSWNKNPYDPKVNMQLQFNHRRNCNIQWHRRGVEIPDYQENQNEFSGSCNKCNQ